MISSLVKVHLTRGLCTEWQCPTPDVSILSETSLQYDTSSAARFHSTSTQIITKNALISNSSRGTITTFIALWGTLIFLSVRNESAGTRTLRSSGTTIKHISPQTGSTLSSPHPTACCCSSLRQTRWNSTTTNPLPTTGYLLPADTYKSVASVG